MYLNKIEIENYKCIDELIIEFGPGENSLTLLGLIGGNEVGKSTILKALAMRSIGFSVSEHDFYNPDKRIQITDYYTLNSDDVEQFVTECGAWIPAEITIDQFVSLQITTFIDYEKPSNKHLRVMFPLVTDGTFHEALNGHEIRGYFTKTMHKSVYWKSEDKYLITEPIAINEFLNNPDDVSIPLKNCFLLAGITDFKKSLPIFSKPLQLGAFEKRLGKAVTKHINEAWPNHHIEVGFRYLDGYINFYILDIGENSMARTIDQRSDGFRQFISFLLTISAQDQSDQLKNCLILLDEPESHLHPKAQEFLLVELKRISENASNNLVLFATHSVHMIDREHLDNYFRVFKNVKTEISRFEQRKATYSSILFDVFEIASSDFHNELYGRLHEKFKDTAPEDKERSFILTFDKNVLQPDLPKDQPWKEDSNICTLPTYVRNCIHHPEGSKEYSQEQLKTSILYLKGKLGL